MDREPSPSRGDDEDHVGDEEMDDIIHQALFLEGSSGFVFHGSIGHRELGAVAMFDPRESSVDDLVALGPTALHDLAGHFEFDYDLASESESDMDVDSFSLVDAAIESFRAAGGVLEQQPHQAAPYQPPRRTAFRQVGG